MNFTPPLKVTSGIHAQLKLPEPMKMISCLPPGKSEYTAPCTLPVAQIDRFLTGGRQPIVAGRVEDTVR